MFTEVWPLDYDPDWPARWSPGERPRPLVVYLDQWCYADKLVRDRAGPLNDENAGCYGVLRSLALDGSVIFPLSQAHYRETWKRENVDARWDTAVVMAELSGFHTLSTSNLVEWEALKCVATFTKAAERIDAPNIIGWGLKHCLSGHEGPAYLMDKRTGKPARWNSLPDDLQRSIAKLEHRVAYRFELAMLALRTPPLESVEMPPFAPIPDNQGDKFLSLEAKIRASIDSIGRSPKKIRSFIEELSYRDSWKYLISALQALGLPHDSIADALDGQPAGLHELFKAMPIQGIFTELRIQTHLKKDWKGLSSDLLDFWTMATVMPFADYFVADKKTYNLAKESRLDERSDCRIIRHLPELCELLRKEVSTQQI